jgi:DNA polymerase-1
VEINPLKIAKSDVYGFDLETTGLKPWEDKILVVSLSTLEGKNYVWDYRKYPKEYWDVLFKELANKLVIGQNIKFDMSFVWYHHGIILNNVWDTMVADQICYNGLKYPHGLYDVVERELKIVIGNKEEKKKLQLSFTQMGSNELSDKQLRYASDDTSYLIDTYFKQKARVSDLLLDRIMDLEMKLTPVLMKMETIGCRIDADSWRKTITDVWEKEKERLEWALDNEVQRLAKENPEKLKKRYKPRQINTTVLYDLFGGQKRVTVAAPYNFNFGSSAQILELFKLLGVPVPQAIDKDTGELKDSVGEDTLMTYLTENPGSILEPFIKLLIEYRGVSKLISTYGDEFLAMLDKRSYIHTTYAQAHTETGRLSSRGPNLQNIPALKPEQNLGDIRQFFVPDEGDVMITADMSGAEVRIAADFSKEQKIIDSLLNDEDLHSKLASISYSIIFGESTTISKSKELIRGYPAKELRDDHKSVLFAKFYKGGAKRIYEILAGYICKFNPPHRHKQISSEISTAIDKELPALSKYLTGLINEAKKNGILRSSILGRLRYFDRETVYGDAANFPIQGVNGEAMKIALIKVDRWLVERNCGRIVLTVHDEMVCTVKKEFAEEAAKYIKSTMASALGWFLETVPGDSTAEIADFWKK